jgi:hypothetical protein
MDSERIGGVMSSSIRTSGSLLGLTDDIGPSSVVGDSIRKSPGDLDSVDKIKNLVVSGTSDDSIDNLTSVLTTVGLVVSTILTSIGTTLDTVRSGVNTNTVTLFSAIIWIFTKRHHTSGLGVSLTSWLRD